MEQRRQTSHHSQPSARPQELPSGGPMASERSTRPNSHQRDTRMSPRTRDGRTTTHQRRVRSSSGASPWTLRPSATTRASASARCGFVRIWVSDNTCINSVTHGILNWQISNRASSEGLGHEPENEVLADERHAHLLALGALGRPHLEARGPREPCSQRWHHHRRACAQSRAATQPLTQQARPRVLTSPWSLTR